MFFLPGVSLYLRHDTKARDPDRQGIGQLCIVANQCDVTIMRQNRDGSWVVAIPRNYGGGTVIGGTRDVSDWNAMPDAAVQEHMLVNAAATYPGLLAQGEEFQVI